MMDGLITGRLTGIPESRIDRNRRPYMVARMRANAGDGSSIPVNIVAFEAAPCAVLRSLAEGDAIALRIENIGPIDAIVRWKDRTEMGVEFINALHPSVLDHLAAHFDRRGQ